MSFEVKLKELKTEHQFHVSGLRDELEKRFDGQKAKLVKERESLREHCVALEKNLLEAKHANNSLIKKLRQTEDITEERDQLKSLCSTLEVKFAGANRTIEGLVSRLSRKEKDLIIDRDGWKDRASQLESKCASLKTQLEAQMKSRDDWKDRARVWEAEGESKAYVHAARICGGVADHIKKHGRSSGFSARTCALIFDGSMKVLRDQIEDVIKAEDALLGGPASPQSCPGCPLCRPASRD